MPTPGQIKERRLLDEAVAAQKAGTFVDPVSGARQALTRADRFSQDATDQAGVEAAVRNAAASLKPGATFSRFAKPVVEGVKTALPAAAFLSGPVGMAAGGALSLSALRGATEDPSALNVGLAGLGALPFVGPAKRAVQGARVARTASPGGAVSSLSRNALDDAMAQARAPERPVKLGQQDFFDAFRGAPEGPVAPPVAAPPPAPPPAPPRGGPTGTSFGFSAPISTSGFSGPNSLSSLARVSQRPAALADAAVPSGLQPRGQQSLFPQATLGSASAPAATPPAAASSFEDLLASLGDDLPTPELVGGSQSLNSLDDLALAAEDAAQFNRAPTAFPESIAPSSVPSGEFTLPGSLEGGIEGGGGAVESLSRILSPRSPLRSPREVQGFGSRLDSFINKLKSEGSTSNFGR